MKHFWRLTLLFVSYKCLQLLIISQCNLQFDSSSQLLSRKEPILSEKLDFPAPLTDFLDRFVIWDAVYFAKLFRYGFSYEHELVFGPLWWRLVNYISGSDNYYTGLMYGILLSNLAHYLSCLLLYVLTKRVFHNSGVKVEHLAFYSSVALTFSPAGVFLTAPYSEPLCMFLTISALLFREFSLDKSVNASKSIRESPSVKTSWLYILSGTLVALAFAVRSNAVFLGIVYLVDLASCIDRRGFILATIAGSQLFLAVVVSQVVPYMALCPDRGEWCNGRIPSFLWFAQSHYWGNGFLQYWSWNNVPNFLFALPNIAILASSAEFFRWRFPQVRGLVYTTWTFLVVCILFWHVQIINRISSFIPLNCWFFALGMPKKRSYYILSYYILWGVLQTFLFASFLPPA